MLIIPAIDLKDGQCVRLKQGDMAQATQIIHTSKPPRPRPPHKAPPSNEPDSTMPGSADAS